jgi:tryptophan synthase beta chain
LLVNLSGRGDKDLSHVHSILEEQAAATKANNAINGVH